MQSMVSKGLKGMRKRMKKGMKLTKKSMKKAKKGMKKLVKKDEGQLHNEQHPRRRLTLKPKPRTKQCRKWLFFGDL